MHFGKAAVLILSAISAVSAEFPPRTTNVDAGKSLKTIFEPKGVKTMFQNLQTTGRRLEGHEGEGAGAAMSEECNAVCDTKEALTAYMENMPAVSKGDYSSLCPFSKTMECMGKEDACRDPGEEEGGGAGSVVCFCNCPVAGKLEHMDEKDYCKPDFSLSCLMTDATCSSVKKDMLKGLTEADMTAQMDIHCKQVTAKCSEKGDKIEMCSNGAMGKYLAAGCDEAASEGKMDAKAAECCPLLKPVADCYTVECMKLDMQMRMIEAKESAEEKKYADKDMEKNYHLGKTCPDTGMSKSWEDVVPPTTTSSSWGPFLMPLPS
jgi:hypothetical protein